MRCVDCVSLIRTLWSAHLYSLLLVLNITKCKDGWTALQAALNGAGDMADTSDGNYRISQIHVGTAKTLIYRGADVKVKCTTKNTKSALSIACSKGLKDLIEPLVTKGANVNEYDESKEPEVKPIHIHKHTHTHVHTYIHRHIHT